MKRLILTLALLAQPALAQDKPRVVKPPADDRPATIERWIKANIDLRDYSFAEYGREGVYLMLPALSQDLDSERVRIWVREEFFAPDEDDRRSSLALVDYDCGARRLRMLAFDSFAQLNMVDRVEETDADVDVEGQAPWSYMRPDTLGETMLAHACKMRDAVFADLKAKR